MSFVHKTATFTDQNFYLYYISSDMRKFELNKYEKRSLYVITSQDKYHERFVFRYIAYRLAFLMILYLS